MTRLELAMHTVDWKIDDAQKEIEQMRNLIKGTIDSDHMWAEADSILNYAQHMAAAAQKLRDLDEQKKMLEYIAKDLEGSGHDTEN